MKKRFFCFLLVLSMLNLPGCYSSREPKELAILSSAVYDKNEDGTYRVALEFMKLSGQSNGGGGGGGGGGSMKESNFIEEVEGPSVREALSHAEVHIAKSLYAGHNQARFYTESFAQNETDVAATLDLFVRDHLTDETANITVIKGNEPDKIFAASLQDSGTVGLYIALSEKNQPRTSSQGVFVTTLDFMRDLYTEGKEPATGVIETQEYKDPVTNTSGSSSSEGGGESGGASKKYRISYEGLAVFRETKLVGFLNGYGAQAYNFLTNKIQTAIITIPFDDNHTVVEITSSSCKIKTTMENSEAKVDISLKIKMNIVMHGGNSDIYQKDVQQSVEKVFNEQMQSEILSTIQLVQTQFPSDIFGFGQQVHIQHPQQWKEMKDNWNDTFSKIPVSVTVDSSIIQVGQIKDSVRWEEGQ